MKRARKPLLPQSYLSARDAAAQFSLSRDYVTRLAREGKIEGTRAGNAWHVSVESLRSFCARQNTARGERHDKLADARRREYGRGVPPARQEMAPPLAEEALESTEEHDMPYEPEPAPSSAAAAMHAAVQRHAAAKDGALQHMKTAPLYAMHPVLDLVHRAGALVAAIAVVVGASMFLAPRSFHTALGVVHEVALGAAAAISSAHE